MSDVGMVATRQKGEWSAILARAAEIVDSYDTRVTLRQLFYRLVSEGALRNTQSEYGQLSSRTAALRRLDDFPELMDAGRGIEQIGSFESPEDARAYLQRVYRRDRTEGQAFNVYLGVEKRGLVAQLQEWFGTPYGLPILPLGGYSSESFEREIAQHSEDDGRESVLLYAGDLDASGEDILRNFLKQTSFSYVERVALTIEQVEEYDLPPLPGKASDARAAGFAEKYGQLFQIEVDALDPNVLRELFAGALQTYWDITTYDDVIVREQRERAELT